MQTGRMLRLIFVSAIISLAALGCSKEKPEEPEVAVQVAAVRETSLQRSVTADAILFPLQQAAIVPKISAPVARFYVKRGSRVHAGELLATLENKDLAAAAQDTKGAYDQAQAAYETTTGASLPEEIEKAKFDAQVNKEAYEAEQKVYDSRKELYAQGALPRKDFEQAGVGLAQAKSAYEISQQHLNALLAIGKQQELKAAAGNLESAKGKYMGATAQLGYSEIHSPIDGWVTDRPLYPGEMAAAGAPLITVMDMSQVIARAHIPQEQAAMVKVGDQATIASADVDQPVEGKVTVVSPALDPNSTTVEVWVQAKNPNRQMRPGSSVHLVITSATVPNALVIPAEAVQANPDGGNLVMLAGQDGKAHQTAVKVGIKQDQDIQIIEGVKPGDRVITAGAYGLPDNTKIKIESAKESEKETASPSDKSKGKDDDEK